MTCVLGSASWPEDLEAVRLLLRNYESFLNNAPQAVLLDGYDRELDELAERWREPDSALLVARLDGAAAGCVGVRMLPDRPASAEVKRLWVEPVARGHRLGHKLAEAAIAWARQHGAHELLLDTIPAAMPDANRLYAALGFVTCARYNSNAVPGIAFFRLALQ